MTRLGTFVAVVEVEEVVLPRSREVEAVDPSLAVATLLVLPKPSFHFDGFLMAGGSGEATKGLEDDGF